MRRAACSSHAASDRRGLRQAATRDRTSSDTITAPEYSVTSSSSSSVGSVGSADRSSTILDFAELDLYAGQTTRLSSWRSRSVMVLRGDLVFFSHPSPSDPEQTQLSFHVSPPSGTENPKLTPSKSALEHDS